MQLYASYSDSDLLRLMAGDNEAAFAELYKRFWDTLFAIAYNRLQSIQAAEDIVHDAFLSLWHNRQKIEAPSLRNYLATAVKYMVLARLRKIGSARKYEQSEKPVTTSWVSPEHNLHFKNILEKVKQEINNLPEKCRLIFRYSRELGLTNQEIAERMHLSPKTVENQISKALRKLRKSLKSFLHTFLSQLP